MKRNTLIWLNGFLVCLMIVVCVGATRHVTNPTQETLRNLVIREAAAIGLTKAQALEYLQADIDAVFPALSGPQRAYLKRDQAVGTLILRVLNKGFVQ